MSDDLVARLRHAWEEWERQLAEDERVALAAGRGWYPDDPRMSDAEIEHTVRHDPARVLAEVERGRRDIAAKRAILDAYANACHMERVTQETDDPGKWEWLARQESLENVVRLLAEAEGLA